jgi:hypothetical protein
LVESTLGRHAADDHSNRAHLDGAGHSTVDK